MQMNAQGMECIEPPTRIFRHIVTDNKLRFPLFPRQLLLHLPLLHFRRLSADCQQSMFSL